ncbi:DUF6803 family protein [Oryzibacter oryziterrae]|uniref:DUF6803 family protein n=1 Tax=Oryzibacter oryziterrae TaxID=2766474 RepID=UPI001F19C704|nr:DUF6803 family protein [Oryzibacter oryziterrae]
MPMTHYMQLLASNQPWNLILFMAVPVIAAETIAISELYLLYTRAETGTIKTLSRAAGILAGVYFTGVFLYLLVTAVIPLTSGGEWRGPADMIAVGAYLAGVIPLGGIALLDLGWLYGRRDAEARLKLHATFVGLFLIVAHVAMIFGMLDPTLLQGNVPDMGGMQMMQP